MVLAKGMYSGTVELFLSVIAPLNTCWPILGPLLMVFGSTLCPHPCLWFSCPENYLAPRTHTKPYIYLCECILQPYWLVSVLLSLKAQIWKSLWDGLTWVFSRSQLLLFHIYYFYVLPLETGTSWWAYWLPFCEQFVHPDSLMFSLLLCQSLLGFSCHVYIMMDFSSRWPVLHLISSTFIGLSTTNDLWGQYGLNIFCWDSIALSSNWGKGWYIYLWGRNCY